MESQPVPPSPALVPPAESRLGVFLNFHPGFRSLRSLHPGLSSFVPRRGTGSGQDAHPSTLRTGSMRETSLMTSALLDRYTFQNRVLYTFDPVLRMGNHQLLAVLMRDKGPHAKP